LFNFNRFCIDTEIKALKTNKMKNFKWFCGIPFVITSLVACNKDMLSPDDMEMVALKLTTLAIPTVQTKEGFAFGTHVFVDANSKANPYELPTLGITKGNRWGWAIEQSKTFNTVTDADGNVYNTVIIGNQEWLKENLKTTKYNDGTPITFVNDPLIWQSIYYSGYFPAYSVYNFDITNKDIYGLFYNFWAINTGKLAPTGWHIPTAAEWDELTNFVGGSDVAGGKLKSTTTDWTSPNLGATNEFGFTALPGGGLNWDGVFYDIYNRAWFWTFTETGWNFAWDRGIWYNYADVKSYATSKNGGFSVRCVRDGAPIIPVDKYPIYVGAGLNDTTNAIDIGEAIVSYDGANVKIKYDLKFGADTSLYKVNIYASDNEPTSVYYTFTQSFENSPVVVDEFETTIPVADTDGDGKIWLIINAQIWKPTLPVTDIDGNIYTTVVIGTQTWMVENLKTTRLNDGTPIENITASSYWGTAHYNQTPAYCWYNNDITYKNPYGALYNQYAVNTGKLAPTGWHVPTSAEWTTLILYLDPTAPLMGASGWESEIAGNKLKEAGSAHWGDPSSSCVNPATNESGFTAVGAGYRYGDTNGMNAYFASINQGSWMWSSNPVADEYQLDLCWSSRVWRYNYNAYGQPTAGFSVRCIKDL
jgi:uncharacterized protein (TIGR02145 family)